MAVAFAAVAALIGAIGAMVALRRLGAVGHFLRYFHLLGRFSEEMSVVELSSVG